MLDFDWTNKTDDTDDVMAEDINAIAQAVIELDGDLDSYKQNMASTIAGLEAADSGIGEALSYTNENIGNLAYLNTTANASLVDAINELVSNFGSCDTLAQAIIDGEVD